MISAAMPKPQQIARHGGAFETSRKWQNGEVSIAPLQPQTPANPPLVENGTAFAIKYLTLSVAAHLPCRATGRGGARNSAARQSHELSSANIGNLLRAARHSDAIGLPLNRMITVHWQKAGLPLEAMAKATGRFTDLLTKVLARDESRTAWIWVHENSGPKGGHCHLLVHVPPHCVKALTGRQKRWLRQITGKPYDARVILSKPIGGRLGLETGNPDLHLANLEAALGYVCKGATQATLDTFGIDRAHQPGGRVIGKRCGTSQNIGAKARHAGCEIHWRKPSKNCRTVSNLDN